MSRVHEQKAFLVAQLYQTLRLPRGPRGVYSHIIIVVLVKHACVGLQYPKMLKCQKKSDNKLLIQDTCNYAKFTEDGDGKHEWIGLYNIMYLGFQ